MFKVTTFVIRPTQRRREIDVLAVADLHRPGEPLIRCEFVVECKWSEDKPSVIFTSRSGHMAPTACIAQTISSSLGSAAAWTLAPEEECHAMKVFRTPASPGLVVDKHFERELSFLLFAKILNECISRSDA